MLFNLLSSGNWCWYKVSLFYLPLFDLLIFPKPRSRLGTGESVSKNMTLASEFVEVCSREKCISNSFLILRYPVTSQFFAVGKLIMPLHASPLSQGSVFYTIHILNFEEAHNWAFTNSNCLLSTKIITANTPLRMYIFGCQVIKA